MNNSPFPPKIIVVLDHERELKFPLPSIWKFEDVSGLDILGGGLDEEQFFGGTKEQPASARQRMQRIIQLLWAGLVADDPAITMEFVGNHVFMGNMTELGAKCTEAFWASLPQPDKTEAEVTGPLAMANPTSH